MENCSGCDNSTVYRALLPWTVPVPLDGWFYLYPYWISQCMCFFYALSSVQQTIVLDLGEMYLPGEKKQHEANGLRQELANVPGEFLSLSCS
ncbi:hypothetical protein ZHAS_00017947 [Anopheles sinensis]|uniref:Uncharacterized protein n=1 Tax=Anopheles sinensis TaxID=74873 RepID=A0A084WI72_ANOSI|nr:hypothetical protein ZHAS_00017947 [Anopheles sinensis]